ncbi:MAG: response regulator [Chitinophagales bacterium]
MSKLSKKLVFIVDDDPDDRQIVLDALIENHPDLDYLFIPSAEELLVRLGTPGADRPQLILLDLNMPGIKGLQALKEIREKRMLTQIPIIVLTTSTLDKDRELSYELGASCFLTKPNTYKKMVLVAHAIVTLWLLEDE